MDIGIENNGFFNPMTIFIKVDDEESQITVLRGMFLPTNFFDH
jgi:hypothetical protein